MPLTKEGAELLLRVKEHILKEPQRLRMSNYIINKDKLEDNELVLRDDKWTFSTPFASWGEPKEQVFPDCNTMGCIGGWCVILSGITYNSKIPFDIADQAMRLLGLRVSEAHRLFFIDGWSWPNHHAYTMAQTPEERAQIVASEIDIFIAEQTVPV